VGRRGRTKGGQRNAAGSNSIELVGSAFIKKGSRRSLGL